MSDLSIRVLGGRASRMLLALTAGAGAVLTMCAALAAPAVANPPGPHDPIGLVEHVSAAPSGAVRFSGWAADPDTLARSVTVQGLVDGVPVASIATSVARADIVKSKHTGPRPGFVLTVPVTARGSHTACLAAVDVASGVDTVLRCVATPLGSTLTSAQTARRNPIGRLERVTVSGPSLHVTGWSSEPDDRARPVTVVLYVDGSPAATLAAGGARSDVARTYGTGLRTGYAAAVSVRSGTHEACVWAVNVGLGRNVLLGCAAADTRGAAGTAAIRTPVTNTRVVAEANKHLGQRYVWGAAGPKTFDCSGLVTYSYRIAGLSTPRVSADQFAAARLIPAARAVPGDLVFYHDAEGHVFHVGIYISPGLTDAAVDKSEGVRHQTISAGSATYGSFTHS